jgi:hypothetical protein
MFMGFTERYLVPKRGLEPPRGFPHYPLKVACLPISPLRHAVKDLVTPIRMLQELPGRIR